MLSPFALLTFPPLSGRPRSFNLHSRRQNRSLPTISPYPPLRNRRPPSLFPQTGWLLNPAHNGWSRQRPLRLPTPRRTFSSSDHEPAIQYLARHWQPAPFRTGGDDGVHERVRRAGNSAKCIWVAERFWWAGYVGLSRKKSKKKPQLRTKGQKVRIVLYCTYYIL